MHEGSITPRGSHIGRQRTPILILHPHRPTPQGEPSNTVAIAPYSQIGGQHEAFIDNVVGYSSCHNNESIIRSLGTYLPPGSPKTLQTQWFGTCLPVYPLGAPKQISLIIDANGAQN